MRSERPNVGDPGRIIAHRGASRTAPENTLAAFRAAAGQGARWVEFDVTLLGDGAAVVHHDATLERCTDGAGPLSAIGLADLDGISAGVRHGADFAGEPLPTLEQTLDLLEALGVHANLEIKRHWQPVGAAAQRVVDALERRAWTAGRIIVSSFDHEELAALRRLMPRVPMAGLWEAPPPDWHRRLDALGAAALHLDFRHLDRDLLSEAARFGFDVRVYTINRPRLMEPFRKLGLTGVITDHPPLFLEDPEWAAWAER